MSRIVAGNFMNLTQADCAVLELRRGGISADRINCSFALASAPTPAREASAEETLPPGRTDVHVAVDAPAASERAFAVGVLRQGGARDVQETEQTWLDGRWIDPNTQQPQPRSDN
jgi:hypothetical protein